jgi:hypothetical protein
MLWEDESDPRLVAYRTPKVFGDKMNVGTSNHQFTVLYPSSL